MKVKELIPYLIIIILCIFLFRYYNNDSLGDDYKQIKTEIDTFYKVDTIKLKKDSLIYIPTPVKEIDTIIPNYIKKNLDSLKNVNSRLNYLLNQVSIKKYDTIYNYNNINIRLRESVSGTIINREVEFNGFTEREVIKIKKRETKTPTFLLSAGLSTSVQTNFNYVKNANVGAVIEFQNAKGYQLEFGYNTAQTFQFSLKKPIFTKY